MKCQLQAVAADWTKAHATQAHMDEGVTTQWAAKQNEKADAYADQGRLRQSPEVKCVAEHYGKTAAAYKDLTSRLRAYMLAVVKKVMELLKEEDPEGILTEKKQEDTATSEDCRRLGKVSR